MQCYRCLTTDLACQLILRRAQDDINLRFSKLPRPELDRVECGSGSAATQIASATVGRGRAASTEVPLDFWALNVIIGLVRDERAEPLASTSAQQRCKRRSPTVLLIQVNGYSDRFQPGGKDVIKLLESSGYRTAIYESNTRTLNDTTAPSPSP